MPTSLRPKPSSLASALALLVLGLSLAAACGDAGRTGSSTGGDDELAGSAGASGAGGAGGGTMCNEAPDACPKGQVCWLTATSGDAFACVIASNAKVGDECAPFVGTTSPCGEGAACVSPSSGSTGKCRAFCTKGGCGAGEKCVSITFGDPPDGGTLPSISVCLPTVGGGAGAPGAAGAGGSGAAGAAGGAGSAGAGGG